MNRVKGFLEAKGINHVYFNIGAVLVAVLLLAVMVAVPFEQTRTNAAGAVITYYAPITTVGNLLVTLTGIVTNVAAFLVFFFGLVFFLGGVGFDVWSEIRNGNMSAAVAISGLAVSIAMSVKG